MCAQYICCKTQRHTGEFDAGTLIQGRLPEAGKELLARYAGQVQMVYLDPPFNTGKKFDMKVRVGEKGYKNGSPTLSLDAYDDQWESREEYLAMMREALVLARGLLKKEAPFSCISIPGCTPICACSWTKYLAKATFSTRSSGRIRPAAVHARISRASTM